MEDQKHSNDNEQPKTIRKVRTGFLSKTKKKSASLFGKRTKKSSKKEEKQP